MEHIDCIASGNWSEPRDTSEGQETLMSLLTDVRARLQNNPDCLTEKENKLTIESQVNIRIQLDCFRESLLVVFADMEYV